MTTLTFFSSVAVAHATPTFGLTESSARAGDLVHFSISGVDGSVTYELEADDTWILDGTSRGAVSDTFTMPDLGDAARTVSVEVKIRWSGKFKKLQSDLDYLGAALPAPDVPAQVPPPAVSVAPQAATPAEPSYSPNGVEGTSPGTSVKHRSKHRRRHSRKRRAIEPARHVARRGERRRPAHRRHDRRHRHAANRKARARHRARHGAAPSDGTLEPGTNAPLPGVQHVEPGIAARPALLAATGARPSGGGHAAVVVPGLLGLAGLAVAGTAVMRRRRLASRRGRH